MITALFTGIAASPWMLAALRYGAVVLDASRLIGFGIPEGALL